MNRITQEAHARQRMIEYFIKDENGTETANRYKVSRKTLYKWKKRYDGRRESLLERSRRPHHSPRAHSAEEIKQIRRVAKKYRWEDLILAYQDMVEKYGYERSYPAFWRQTIEPLFEIPLFGALHLEYLRQAAVLFPHIDFADFIVCGGKINVVCLAFEGESLRQHFFVQWFKRAICKQRLLDFQEKLRDLQRLNIFPELRVYLK